METSFVSRGISNAEQKKNPPRTLGVVCHVMSALDATSRKGAKSLKKKKKRNGVKYQKNSSTYLRSFVFSRLVGAIWANFLNI